MRRVIWAVTLLAIGLAVLSSCAIDPCSIDARSPSCAVQQTQAHATISALEGEQAMRAAQATLAIQGTRQAAQAQSTQAAVQQRATDQVVNGEATKIALQVGSAIEKANAESAALPFATWFQIIAFWFVLPCLAVIAVIWSGRKIVTHGTAAISQAMHKHVAMVTYGQENNPQMAYLLFDPKTDQPIKFITAEGLVGNYLDLLNNDTVLQSLNIPDDVRLATLVEASKRSQAARIAAATGLAPWARTSAYARLEPGTPTAQPETPAIQHVPTFAEYLQHWQPTLDQMLFGFGADGQPIYVSIDQMLSALAIGRQNQGKTTLLRMIDVQCEMVGVKVLAWDIHDDLAEDIPGVVTYSRAADIERSAEEMYNELERRIRLRLKHNKAQPIMILVDEVNEIVEQVPMLPKIIKRIVSEGRKFRMFEFITAKGAPADIFEKSWARDSFGALISFWTSSLQARNAGFETDAARSVESLTPGRALLRLQTSPAQIVTFPDIPPGDMSRLLPGSNAQKVPFSPVFPGSVEPANQFDGTGSGTGLEPAVELDPELAMHAEQIRDLLRARTPVKEIIRLVWGEAATTGNAYKVYSEKFRNIVATMV